MRSLPMAVDQGKRVRFAAPPFVARRPRAKPDQSSNGTRAAAKRRRNAEALDSAPPATTRRSAPLLGMVVWFPPGRALANGSVPPVTPERLIRGRGSHRKAGKRVPAIKALRLNLHPDHPILLIFESSRNSSMNHRKRRPIRHRKHEVRANLANFGLA